MMIQNSARSDFRIDWNEYVKNMFANIDTDLSIAEKYFRGLASICMRQTLGRLARRPDEGSTLGDAPSTLHYPDGQPIAVRDVSGWELRNDALAMEWLLGECWEALCPALQKKKQKFEEKMKSDKAAKEGENREFPALYLDELRRPQEKLIQGHKPTTKKVCVPLSESDGEQVADESDFSTISVTNLDNRRLLKRVFIAAKLTQKDRQLLISHHLQGRTLPDLAAEWNTPINTLKDRQKRLMKKLREAAKSLEFTT